MSDSHVKSFHFLKFLLTLDGLHVGINLNRLQIHYNAQFLHGEQMLVQT